MVSAHNGLIDLSDEDLDLLAPGIEFPIGKTVLHIRPLSLTNYAKLVKRIKEVVSQLSGNPEFDAIVEKVKTMDFSDILNPAILGIIPEVVQLAENYLPELLELLTSVNRDSISKLPPDITISLLQVCVEVNLESQGSLVKNLVALTNGLIPESAIGKLQEAQDQTIAH